MKQPPVHSEKEPASRIMTERESRLLSSTVDQFQRAPVSMPKTAATHLTCLIVSQDAVAREGLELSASQAGWSVDLFSNVEAAESAAQTRVYRLGLIHVPLASSSPLDRTYQRICRQIQQQPAGLLVVCGQEDDPDGEIWARQLGVWIYLPGIASLAGLAGVCSDAAVLVSRQLGLAPPASLAST